MLTRLEQFIKCQGLTIHKFEQKISASNGQIRRAIRNKTTLQTDVIEKIGSVFGELSLDWLFRGTGEMIHKTTQILNFDDTKSGDSGADGASSVANSIVKSQQETINAQAIAINAQTKTIESLTRENNLLYEKIRGLKKEDAPAADNAECAVAV